MAEEIADRIGARIRARRLELGLNQRRLAERIPNDAVNNQRVSDWERGVHQPSERHLRQLAEALQVDYAYFFAPPESSTSDTPLLNVLNGDADKLDEALKELRLLVERQEAVEAALTTVGERVEELLRRERPRRQRSA